MTRAAAERRVTLAFRALTFVIAAACFAVVLLAYAGIERQSSAYAVAATAVTLLACACVVVSDRVVRAACRRYATESGYRSLPGYQERVEAEARVAARVAAEHARDRFYTDVQIRLVGVAGCAGVSVITGGILAMMNEPGKFWPGVMMLVFAVPIFGIFPVAFAFQPGATEEWSDRLWRMDEALAVGSHGAFTPRA